MKTSHFRASVIRVLWRSALAVGVLGWENSATASQLHAQPELDAVRQLCAEGRITAAAELSARILIDARDSRARDDADRLLEVCLRETGQREQGIAQLLELGRSETGSIVAARSLLIAADVLYWTDRDCSRCEGLYDEVRVRFPSSEEAFRATIAKALRCLTARGEDDRAIEDLKSVHLAAGDSVQGAYALYEVGILEQWIERRKDARATFEEVVREYPQSLEYPRTGGIHLVRSAEVSLKELDRYRVSPMLDMGAVRVRRALGLQKTPLDSIGAWWAVWVDEVVVLLARLLSLIVVLGLVCVFRKMGMGSQDLGRDQFTHRRGVGSTGMLLMGAWLLSFAPYCVAVAWVHMKAVPTIMDVALTWVPRASTGAPIVLMLILALRGESLRKIMRIRKSLIGSMVLAVLASTVVVACVLWIGSVMSNRLAGQRTSVGIMRDLPGSDSWGLSTVLWVLFVLVGGALAEECVYRGVVYESFRGASNASIATVLSSVLFALAHVAPLERTVGVALFGGVAVCLRERYGSLVPPVLFHTLSNIPAALRVLSR